MIQVREFFTELEYLDDKTFTVKRQIDKQINQFIRYYSDSIKEIIDIKYRTTYVDNCIQSSALLIYKIR